MIRLAMVLTLLAGAASAAGPVDPDWPCIQRRQPQLSVAQLWPGPPLDEAALAGQQSAQIRQLAQVLAQRRVSIEAAGAQIKDFAASATPQELAALFLATFELIQNSRGRVMAGITRYAHKQEALDAHIKEMRQQFSQLMAAEPKDFDAIDKVEEDIDWSTRIFLDRQQSLTYVCETPVILEQRAFALARVISGLIPK